MHFQLINCQCGGELELVDMIVANMMGRLVDSDHVVRKYCIRGLGNVGNTHETLVSFKHFYSLYMVDKFKAFP